MMKAAWATCTCTQVACVKVVSSGSALRGVFPTTCVYMVNVG